MAAQDKKSVIKDLIELGKSKGKLTTKEITDALEELDFDVEKVAKLKNTTAPAQFFREASSRISRAAELSEASAAARTASASLRETAGDAPNGATPAAAAHSRTVITMVSGRARLIVASST